MVASANSFGSSAELTTRVTEIAAVAAVEALETGNVSVGTVVGAVNTPFCEIVPQFGLQVAPKGLAEPQAPPLTTEGKALQMAVLDPATGCMTAHFGLALAGEIFKNDAVNWICCAGFRPTGAVAVVGVTDTRIPVSSETTTVPVLWVSAAAVAVNVIVGTGLGKLLNAGAV